MAQPLPHDYPKDFDFYPCSSSQGSSDMDHHLFYPWRHITAMQPPGSPLGGEINLVEIARQATQFAQGNKFDCWLLAPVTAGLRKVEEAARVFLTEGGVNEEFANLELVDMDRRKNCRVDQYYPFDPNTGMPAYCKPSENSFGIPSVEKCGAKLCGNFGILDGGKFGEGASMVFHGYGIPRHLLERAPCSPFDLTWVISNALLHGCLVGLGSCTDPKIKEPVNDSDGGDQGEHCGNDVGVGAGGAEGNGGPVPLRRVCFEYLPQAPNNHAYAVLEQFFIKINGLVESVLVLKNVHNTPTFGSLYPGSSQWDDVDPDSKDKIMKWIDKERGILVTTASICFLKMQSLHIFYPAAPVPAGLITPQIVQFEGRPVEVHFHDAIWQPGAKPFYIVDVVEKGSLVSSSIGQPASRKKLKYFLVELRLYQIPHDGHVWTHKELAKREDWLITTKKLSDKQVSVRYFAAESNMRIAVLPIFFATNAKDPIVFSHTTRITANPKSVDMPLLELDQYSDTLGLQARGQLDFEVADAAE